MSHFLDNLIAFGRLLRRHGLQVDTGRLLTLSDALQFIDIGSRDDVKAACRTILLQRQDDIPTFDRLFDIFWSTDQYQSLSRRRSPDSARAESDAASPKGFDPVDSDDHFEGSRRRFRRPHLE